MHGLVFLNHSEREFSWFRKPTNLVNSWLSTVAHKISTVFPSWHLSAPFLCYLCRNSSSLLCYTPTCTHSLTYILPCLSPSPPCFIYSSSLSHLFLSALLPPSLFPSLLPSISTSCTLSFPLLWASEAVGIIALSQKWHCSLSAAFNDNTAVADSYLVC